MGERESLAKATGMAMHDLNNLLMVIIGNADLVAETLPPGSPARESIEEILQAALKAQTLSDRLHARARDIPDAA
jgi:signal transduction histidine kinase